MGDWIEEFRDLLNDQDIVWLDPHYPADEVRLQALLIKGNAIFVVPVHPHRPWWHEYIRKCDRIFFPLHRFVAVVAIGRGRQTKLARIKCLGTHWRR